MAGDLPFEEILVIHQEPKTTATAATRAGAPVLAEAPDEPAARVLQRYGDRVEIRMGAFGEEAAPVRAPKVPAKLLESLTETERLGVQALQLRASKAHVKAKANRPRE